MSNQTTKQLINNSISLKDLELLLCKTVSQMFTQIESEIQVISELHYQKEEDQFDYDPEVRCQILFNQISFLHDLVKEFESKAYELRIKFNHLILTR